MADKTDFSTLTGLTSAEVEAATAAGQVNADAGTRTRTVGDILRANILTLFNLINVILFLLVLTTGSLKNGLFMVLIVINTVIGIVQEIRSKKVTDKLSIIAGNKAKVIRDGARSEIPIDAIVRGDVIVLGRGDQVPADSTAIAGSCRMDESLLTGESNLIVKTTGAELMSGSFVSSGMIAARVEHVGAENYAARISAEAKKHKKIKSEIMDSLNGIIRFVSIIIFPVGTALFFRMFLIADTPWDEAMLSAVAALVGMVPEGLILLTSIVLALAVIRLSQHRVLVQQLYCIETLAHVDTLCLDKTGTITTGAMEVSALQMISGTEQTAHEALGAIATADPDPNETAQAIAAWSAASGTAVPETSGYVPFSSERKWSGVTLADGRSFAMGAGQFLLKDGYAAIAAAVEPLAADARVLVLAQVDGFDDETICGTPTPLALISITDQIRSSAAQTIGYFKEQGVDVKVISGDDPRTVAKIARTVGVPDADRYMDASLLDTKEEIAAAVNDYHVFGRVKPEQKKAFVKALQAAGHTVAMTGDGVNDTLALKAADCSVAMAAGSDAARNVAQLVLVDNDFAAMPKVVGEGRRSINNLERSAALFLVKTVFSMVLAVVFIFLPWQYPFQPIQMTLISAFTVGIPSFVLALEPNNERIKGHFLENVVVRSLPGSLTVILMVLAVNIFGYLMLGLNFAQVSTICVLLTAWVGVNLIFRISLPFTPIRVALLVFVVVGCVAGACILPHLFSISAFTAEMWPLFIIAALASIPVFNLSFNAFGKWHAKRQAALV